MAQEGSWQSIQRLGLLSTTALLDVFEVPLETRAFIESQRRPESVRISHPIHGDAIIRDNKPLPESKLIRCLTDMTPKQWYETLNRKVFFWPNRTRVIGLLEARAYRKKAHSVITVDSRLLLSSHSQDVFLSRINSGAVIYNYTQRGSETFIPLAEWPRDVAPRSGKLINPIAELAVEYGIPNIRKFVVRVEEMAAGRRERVIWMRE